MQTNGGVAPAARARELPIALSASGPAAGVIGGGRLAELVGEGDALTFDMGGTTADIGLVLGADPQVRFSGEAAGMPINLPQIDVLCIGAGGGSIARVDEFGSLTVGPASAGADPGPAAYGKGGTEATVTDAHVVLGTLSSEHSLAGGVPLDRELARAAVMSSVGEPLGLDAEAAAEAILRIANANMANALRLMTVARGHDPRRFALVAIGGAGPMHACALADEVGIPRVVVPRYPGVAAALGLLATDIRHDLRRSWLRAVADITPAQLDAELERLEAEARELLGTSDAVTTAIELDHELDMRYRGQAYNLTVPFAGRPVSADDDRRGGGPVRRRAPPAVRLHARGDRYRDRHPAGPRPGPHPGRSTGTHPRPPRRRTGQPPGVRSTPGAAPAAGRSSIARRCGLTTEIAPETIVEQEDATIVVPAGWRGRVGAGATLVLEREEA